MPEEGQAGQLEEVCHHLRPSEDHSASFPEHVGPVPWAPLNERDKGVAGHLRHEEGVSGLSLGCPGSCRYEDAAFLSQGTVEDNVCKACVPWGSKATGSKPATARRPRRRRTCCGRTTGGRRVRSATGRYIPTMQVFLVRD
jgi:hypothetical protein